MEQDLRRIPTHRHQRPEQGEAEWHELEASDVDFEDGHEGCFGQMKASRIRHHQAACLSCDPVDLFPVAQVALRFHFVASLNS